jgi:hypothetical protein
MKPKQFIALVIVLSLLSLTAVTVHGYSDGPPDGHTGGNGEPTCAKSGCHDNAEPNSGSGRGFVDAPPTYIPGEVVQMTIRIDDLVKRFGFQIKAVDSAGNSTGTFKLQQEEFTQMSEKDGTVYIKQTEEGSGTNGWPVEWTAPGKGTGTVTIYGAFVGANNDSSPDHDSVYLFQHNITEEKTGDDSPGFELVAAITAVSFMALVARMERRRGRKP